MLQFLGRGRPITHENQMIMNISEMRCSRTTVLVVVSLAIFADMFNYGVIVPILPSILLRTGVINDARLSILYVCYAIGLFVTTPIIGWFSDRYKTRQVPMLMGVSGLICSTLIFAHASSFRLLLLARAFQGASAAATWVIGFALLADTFPCDDGLGTAVGIAMGGSSAGYIAGPCLGGILAKLFGSFAPFFFCFGLAILDLAGRLFIRPSNLQNVKLEKCHFHATMLKDRKLYLVLLVVVLSASIFSAVETFTPDHLAKKFQLDDFWISQIFMAFIIPIILGSLIVGKVCDKGISRIKIIALGLFLHALSAPFVGFSPDLGLFIVSAVSFGATYSLIATPSMPELAAIVQQTGSDSYAHVYAAFNIAYSIGMTIGPLVVGKIKSRMSFGSSLSVISLVIILYAPTLTLLYRKK